MPENHPLSLPSYNKLVEPHRRALKRLELNFSFFALDIGQVNLFSVIGRIKTYQSAVRKSDRLGLPIQDLDDLAGLRVVVGTSAEVPVVERFFTRQEISKDLIVTKHQRIERPTGYRAVHMVLQFKGNYQSSVFPGRVEVQVHTIFEHAFNFLSHSWSYKQPWKLSSEWSSKFAQLSNLLEDINNAASRLHTDVLEASTDSESANLSPYSVQILIKSEFNEELCISDCTDACRMYTDIGYETNGQLRSFFRSTEVAELYELALGGKATNELSEGFTGMSKNGFWIMFGTQDNTPELRELITRLRSK